MLRGMVRSLWLLVSLGLTCVAASSCGESDAGRRGNTGSSTSGGASTGGANAGSTGASSGGNTAGTSGGVTGVNGTNSTGANPDDPDAGNSNGPGDDGGTEPQPGDPVRFIVFGDGGTGLEPQKKVARAVRDVCKARGCQFALYMGDNIYETGVASEDDALFQTHFEDAYVELDFPFYVVLGNHDYGGSVLGIGGGLNAPGTIIDERAQAQLAYALKSDKWKMPASYYTFRKGPVAFFGLDTNSVVTDLFRPLSEQQAWLDAEMAKSDAPWKIVFGHHPYVSNGEHGNAGDYKGPIGFEFHTGATFKELVDESVCGKAQVYMSGHDHHREWLDACDTSFIVSGAAAKLDDKFDRGSPSRWSDSTKLGFMWAEIVGDTFTGIFYDEDGKLSFQSTETR
jgi:hypothetical protein